MRFNTTEFAAKNASASFRTDPVYVQSMDRISVQLYATGTVTGTAVIEFSNDKLKGVNAEALSSSLTHWSSLAATQISLSGTGLYLIPTTDLCYTGARVFVSASSGSAGTVSMNVSTYGY